MSKKGGGGGGDGKKGKKRVHSHSLSSQPREASVEVVDSALPPPAVPPVAVDLAQQMAPLMDLARQMAPFFGAQFVAPVPTPLPQQQPVPKVNLPPPTSRTPPTRSTGRQGCRHPAWRGPPPPAHESVCRQCRGCGRVEMLDWVVVKKEGPVTPSPKREEE